jgi:hypothetical protein
MPRSAWPPCWPCLSHARACSQSDREGRGGRCCKSVLQIGDANRASTRLGVGSTPSGPARVRTAFPRIIPSRTHDVADCGQDPAGRGPPPGQQAVGPAGGPLDRPQGRCARRGHLRAAEAAEPAAARQHRPVRNLLAFPPRLRPRSGGAPAQLRRSLAPAATASSAGATCRRRSSRRWTSWRWSTRRRCWTRRSRCGARQPARTRVPGVVGAVGQVGWRSAVHAPSRMPPTQAEFEDMLEHFVGRETPLYHAKRLSERFKK